MWNLMEKKENLGEHNECSNKQQCAQNKEGTWEEKGKEDVFDEDINHPMDKTPTHQEDQGNQKRKQPNYDWYQVDQ